MIQSRTWSAIEIGANVLIGYVIAISTQVIVFPLFGLEASLHEQLWLGLIFTAVSILRGYTLRRLFNRIHRWQAGE